MPPEPATPPVPPSDETVCLNCGESQQLVQFKGCLRCLRCGFKFDCNGW